MKRVNKTGITNGTHIYLSVYKQASALVRTHHRHTEHRRTDMQTHASSCLGPAEVSSHVEHGKERLDKSIVSDAHGTVQVLRVTSHRNLLVTSSHQEARVGESVLESESMDTKVRVFSLQIGEHSRLAPSAYFKVNPGLK